jgi:hypothetical protein
MLGVDVYDTLWCEQRKSHTDSERKTLAWVAVCACARARTRERDKDGEVSAGGWVDGCISCAKE